MARVLITGAAGNLGGKLVAHWRASGAHELVLLDRAGGADVVGADISVFVPDWADRFAGVEVIVHLAGQISPASKWAEVQPANIVGGYMIAALVSSAALWLFPGSWESAATAVGATIAFMAILRVTHPPAGAIPLVAFASHFELPLLTAVVLAGSVLMIAIGVLHHRIPPRQQYPLRAP